MTDITLIFPDQLFLDHPSIASGRPIFLVEEFLFFKVQSFHKQKLVLMKSAMRQYAKMLLKNKHEVIYIYSKDLSSRGNFLDILGEKHIKNIHIAEFADEWLNQDLTLGGEKYGWKFHFYPSPGFISSNENLETFFAGKKHYSMAQFYAYQRKKPCWRQI